MFRNTKGNHRDREGFREFLGNLEALPPRELEQRLLKMGYRGQERARRSVCLMAYRHVRRILRVFRDRREAETMTPKFNYLLMGPTGCGKTYITELLFNRILKVPSVTVDITAYSETGYVGQDPNAILTRLLHASSNNPLLAMVGVICLDEFDKLSSGANNAVFAGAGTTKDVTGRGVQRELLKMLEGADIEVPSELTHSSYAERVVLSTRHMTFVACGAFSGFNGRTRDSNTDPTIGFDRTPRPAEQESIAVKLSQDEVERTAYFQRYGFMPELIGRFTRIVPFQPLDEETLLRILDDNILSGFIREFEDEAITLRVDEDVRRFIVRENLRKETGARGLSAILTRYLEGAAFHVFGERREREVVLSLNDDDVVCLVDGEPQGKG